jgi:hypothetical protein
MHDHRSLVTVMVVGVHYLRPSLAEPPWKHRAAVQAWLEDTYRRALPPPGVV